MILINVNLTPISLTILLRVFFFLQFEQRQFYKTNLPTVKSPLNKLCYFVFNFRSLDVHCSGWFVKPVALPSYDVKRPQKTSSC